MANPQLTLFMLPSGEIKAEAPGRNGMRRAIAFDSRLLPPELLLELQWQRAALGRESAEAIRKATADRIAQEARIERKERDEAREAERAAAREIAQAHALYETVDRKHGEALANRVIPDAARRPRIARRIAYLRDGTSRAVVVKQEIKGLKRERVAIIKRDVANTFAALAKL